MSLRRSLWQSIAALDRIAPETHPDLDGELDRDHYNDEKIAYRNRASSDPHLPRFASRDDEKFIRLSTSTASLASQPYFRHTCPQRHLRNSQCLPEVDFSEMDPSEVDHEPKLTLRYVTGMTLRTINVFFSACVPAIGIVIIGLAADNIAWSTSNVTVVMKAIITGSSTEF